MVLLSALLGCSKADPDFYVVPDGAVQAWYAPQSAFTTFPDDYHTVEEPLSATGLALRFQDAGARELAESIPPEFNVVEALELLDGFGTTAGVQLRFVGRVDELDVRFVRLDDGTEVGFELEWVEDADDGSGDRTAILFPLFPLEPATAYGIVATGTDEAGDAVWASPDLHSMLTGTSVVPGLQRLEGRYAQLLDVTGVKADDVAHAVVFTTQSIDDSLVAERLAETTPTLTSGGCTDDGTMRTCNATLKAVTFMDELGRMELAFGQEPEVVGDYDVPVLLRMPLGPGPHPVLILGHGLGGDRGEGGRLARDLAGIGIAVASIDAPMHNDHPTLHSSSDFFWILEFFGISATDGTFDIVQLRDHWRQAAYDKEQLARALHDFDVDADGTPDLDATEVFYSGHSLGGTMGPQALALIDNAVAADLSVPGSRVGDIVRKGETFQLLVGAMAPAGTPQAVVDRFFPLLQTAIERGDPGNYAGQLGDVDLLVTMVIDDAIMPNLTTRAISRALDLQHAGPVLQEVEGLEAAKKLPLSANRGGVTAVHYQFDQKLEDDELLTADHEDAHSNELGRHQVVHFWQTRLDSGRAEVVDPFDALGL